MAVKYNADSNTFILETRDTSYLMKVSRYGNLLHLYYGERIPDENLDYLIKVCDRGFSPNPNEAGNDRTFSLDYLAQEYSTDGKGDYRIPSIEVVNGDGSQIFSGKVSGYKIYKGKYGLEGMPSLKAASKDTVDTLEIELRDKESGGTVLLFYSVFEEKNIVTRTVRFINNGREAIRLEKLASVTMDFKDSDYDFIVFSGRHTMEREFTRIPIQSGVHSVGSSRGASSHQYNPFAIVCDRGAGEDYGRCFGYSLVYSGNFAIEAEKDQFKQLRINAGINPQDFSWLVNPGEEFQAPEAVLAFSGEGFARLSHLYHDVYRENLCRSPFAKKPRPVVINSWEAAYFDFDDEKLLGIAKEAVDMGVDLFVLDDGWFGKRDDDNSGLGDWKVNLKKLKRGISGLSEEVHALGLQFGIWIEPEMVSEDSELFRAHPDWCLKAPGRPMTRGRNQLVLDLSRHDVCDYLIEAVNGILHEAKIEYVKWDMNRSISDVWSGLLDAGRQGETLHRYILGLYYVMDEVILKHPEVIFCGCAGGGGRFDPAMLFYQPQIWCSDNTDAKNRLKIQYGTSFAYPINTIESHVSVCPNHQTGRYTPLKTRGIVSMDGILGYELDSTKLSAKEKAVCREQVKFYKKNYRLIAEGDYYRLASPYENPYFTAWQHVSKDKKKSLVSLVLTDREGNDAQRYLKLKGLDREAMYQIEGQKGQYSGSLLMNAGLPVPYELDEYEGVQFCLRKI
ncbi:MAG: alpha-galactosidase [Lachnospiraceae bacterium]|nr:alpha-galactosidase [Lachnospiraceae bacterium]